MSADTTVTQVVNNEEPPLNPLYKTCQLSEIEFLSRQGWVVHEIVDCDSLQSYSETVVQPPTYQGGYPINTLVQKYVVYKAPVVVMRLDRATGDRVQLNSEIAHWRRRAESAEQTVRDHETRAAEVIVHVKEAGENQ